MQKRGWPKGKPRSAETRAKMSAAKSGANHPMFGKHFSAEVIARNSAGHKGQVPWIKGRHHSEATRAKMRASQQARFAAQRETA